MKELKSLVFVACFAFLHVVVLDVSANNNTPGNSSSQPGSESEDYHHPVSYKGFKVIRLTPKTADQVAHLSNFVNDNAFEGSGVDAWSQPSTPGHSVDLLVSPEKIGEVHSFAVQHALNGSTHNLIEDVNALIEKTSHDSQSMTRSRIRQGQPKNDASSPATIEPTQFFSKFRRLHEIHNFLKFLEMKYPHLVSIETIGKSFENRDINVIRITSNVNRNQGSSKPIFLMDGGLHSREWLSPATVLVVAYTLASQYSRNNDVKRMLDSWDIRIVPVANPDGYEYTHTTDRLWRKTRSSNGNSVCRGVDPNRNFDFKWMVKGASSNPCSHIYAGVKPFSEPEVRSLASYMMQYKNDIKIYIAVHSYSQLWLSPWGYANEVPPDSEILLSKGKESSQCFVSSVWNSLQSWSFGYNSVPCFRRHLTILPKEGLVFHLFTQLNYPPPQVLLMDSWHLPTKIKPTGIETTVSFVALALDVLQDLGL